MSLKHCQRHVVIYMYYINAVENRYMQLIEYTTMLHGTCMLGLYCAGLTNCLLNCELLSNSSTLVCVI